MSLSIIDYADYALLHLIDDHVGDTTPDLAAFLEVSVRSVAQRLRHMKDHGLVSKDLLGGWSIARRGRVLLDTRGESIEVVQRLSHQAKRDPVAGWVAKREWARNVQ